MLTGIGPIPQHIQSAWIEHGSQECGYGPDRQTLHWVGIPGQHLQRGQLCSEGLSVTPLRMAIAVCVSMRVS